MQKNAAQLLIVRNKYIAISYCLNERGRRLWAATEAESYGRGGIALVCKRPQDFQMQLFTKD